jgi:YD repeat-containing protein
MCCTIFIPLSTSCEYHPDYHFKTIYEYSERGNVRKETRRDPRGISETMVYIYNPGAQLIMETRFLHGSEFDYCVTCAYDLKGRLIRQTKKQADGEIAYDQIILHEKNTTENIIKTIYTDANNYKICFTLERHLDEYGNIIRYIARDRSGVVYDDWVYEYDVNGNMMHKIWKTPTETVEYFMTYDKRGHLIESELIAPMLDRADLYSTVWEYGYEFDDKGRILTHITREDDALKWVVRYEYDNLGRIKEKREYDIYSRGIEAFTACFQ